MCRETTIINERVGEEKSRSTAPILSHRSPIDSIGKTVQARSDGTKKTTVGGLDDGSQATNKGPASVNITFH